MNASVTNDRTFSSPVPATPERVFPGLAVEPPTPTFTHLHDPVTGFLFTRDLFEKDLYHDHWGQGATPTPKTASRAVRQEKQPS